mmetsp:Transcript_29705/g.44051  ORF Transcript_29705/g.44051 Transcript_29705/m.44051 type:complete len:414 (+) Transcript_29705:97-1338(+)|eukprot:CAMPEP_0195508384 /NCGR_PEP_ID=MMETSP0794_2-20130614/1601_1 /TAXON_ID=515487 /ORGANISM="Stephanopyxis turris, Strain CCMP 815" /LENGTH=413 /DNA_ID=CAMNT_0040635329 /DNA_START=88 /DNA_END=1329 /DNA_ORIENTATION=+
MAWFPTLFGSSSKEKKKEVEDPTHDDHRAKLQNLSIRERNQPIAHRFFTKHQKIPVIEEKTHKRPSVIIHHPPWKVPAINDPFPNLEGDTQENNDFNLYEYKGNNWAMIFTHPVEFTPVCTSEFAELLKLKTQFEENEIKIVGFSTNDTDTHRNWLMDVEALVNGYHSDDPCSDKALMEISNVNNDGNSCATVDASVTSGTSSNPDGKVSKKEEAEGIRVDFPIYSDPTLEMAVELGILDEDVKDEDGLPVTARSVYVLTPSNKIALITTYPTTLGRNWREILRAIMGLKLVAKANSNVHIPSHWRPGDRVLIDPTFDDAKCDEVFGTENWDRVMLPSEVEQEIATFSKRDGGIKVKKTRSSLMNKKKKSKSISVGKPDPVVLPRHYMRYTNQPPENIAPESIALDETKEPMD